MPSAASYDGTNIAYSQSGTGAVNLIFFHGWGGNRHVWDEVLPKLDGNQFRCLAVDLRGHGESACPASGYDWDGFSRDMLAVADHEGARQFIPVGFSMGAKLACYLAAKHPERMPSQILVAPGPLGVVPIERELGLQICRDADDWNRIRPFFRNFWFGANADDKLVDHCCQWVERLPRFVREATAEMSLWQSIEATVGILDLPTRFICGEEDAAYNLTFHQAHTLHHFSRTACTTLPAAHFVPLERPQELAAVIAQSGEG